MDIPDDAQLKLPLLPAVFHIMACAGGWGAARVRHQTRGRVPDGRGDQPGPGTLCGTLRRMLEEELIEECGDGGDDDRRRYYRLTAAGRRLAAAEAERLEKLVRLARTKDLLVRPRTVR